MTFICYENCTTCKKAKVWLDYHESQYEMRDIKKNNPTYEELKLWHENSGLPVKRFFNTSGTLYKTLHLKEKLPTMDDEQILRLLATDGMLVKRPILVNGDKVCVGFKEDQWREII